ncbi:MAG: hypothetical protein WDO56_12030 [Gammaproteobacteria bacterium]
MVFLAMTRQGFEGYCQLSSGSRASLWIPGGVLAPEELSELRARGLDVTNFGSEIRPGDVGAVADAISTIREHHPNEPLWVEG